MVQEHRMWENMQSLELENFVEGDSNSLESAMGWQLITTNIYWVLIICQVFLSLQSLKYLVVITTLWEKAILIEGLGNVPGPHS